MRRSPVHQNFGGAKTAAGKTLARANDRIDIDGLPEMGQMSREGMHRTGFASGLLTTIINGPPALGRTGSPAKQLPVNRTCHFEECPTDEAARLGGDGFVAEFCGVD